MAKRNNPDLAHVFLLLQSMGHSEMPREEVAAYIAKPGRTGELVRALGLVIDWMVPRVNETWHLTVVPRLTTTPGVDPKEARLMQGVLNAASIGAGCYAWRLTVGPLDPDEPALWALTAHYLCESVDELAVEPGHALSLIDAAIRRTETH